MGSLYGPPDAAAVLGRAVSIRAGRRNWLSRLALGASPGTISARIGKFCRGSELDFRSGKRGMACCFRHLDKCPGLAHDVFLFPPSELLKTQMFRHALG